MINSTHDQIVAILTILRPGANWGLTDKTIEWLDLVQTQPTDQEIDAAVSLVPTFLTGQLRNQAISFLNSGVDPVCKLERAIFMVILDEINLIRSLLVPSQGARTLQQFKTAVQNKLTSGLAD